jgi:hypothetical protein
MGSGHSLDTVAIGWTLVEALASAVTSASGCTAITPVAHAEDARAASAAAIVIDLLNQLRRLAVSQEFWSEVPAPLDP